MEDLLTLAARVESEPPSRELRDDVLVAFGWTTRMEWNGTFWVDPSGKKFTAGEPNPLTSLDAARSAMPDVWRVWSIRQRPDVWLVTLSDSDDWSVAEAKAKELAAAWTAAALRAKAWEAREDG